MLRASSLIWLFLLATYAAAPLESHAADKPVAKEANEKSGDKQEKKRKTATVEQKSLTVEVAVDGSFVSREMTPIMLLPETWSGFTIEEVVPHGASVRSGETLIKFDDKKLDEAIAELELNQRLSELSLRKAEQELPRLEKSLEMDLVDAKQRHERTHADYDRYQEEGRERELEQMKMSLKRSKQGLDYARDELKQLEQMYEADDLTEETEEIILTRTRQQVEAAEFFYKYAKIRYEETLNITMPRRDEDEKEMIDRVDMSLERAKLTKQLDLNRARYELEKQRISHEKSLERHAKLIEDRGLMSIKSPAAGVVYYGSCVNGKWGDMASMQTKLLPHKSAPTGATLMTIVNPAKLYLVGTLSEKDMPSVNEGQPAKITPTGDGAEALPGAVAAVSSVPVAPGKFSFEVELSADDKPAWLMPGMTGKIKITTYENDQALLVAKKAVHSEEDSSYVWLVAEEDGKSTVKKQEVEVGKTKGDLVEIVDGLDAGDTVSLEDEAEDKHAGKETDDE